MARIGIDLDGCVYDFVGSLRYYIGCTDDTCSMHSTPTRWEFYEDWGMNLEQFLKVTQKGVDAGIVFTYGDAMEGSVEAIEALWEAGHEIVFITDRGGFKGAKYATAKWLREHLPPRIKYELHFTADKTSVPTDYFIDDRPSNVAAFGLTDTLSVLMRRPWNDSPAYNDYRSVATWKGFVYLVEACEREREGYEALAQAVSIQPAQSDEVRVTSETGGQKGQKQARLGSIDPQALMEMAKVAGFGEVKYDRLNYLKGYDWSLSYDAAQRHFHAFWSGEDLDPESGLPHLAHAGWHCMAMLAFMIHGLGTDNRYRKGDAA